MAKPTKIKLDHLPEITEYLRVVPFEYQKSPTEKHKCFLVPEKRDILEEALNRLENGESLRQASKYISEMGYNLTAMGLLKKWREYCPESEILRERELQKKRKARQLKKISKGLSAEEKKLQAAQKQAAAEKRKITNAQKRLEKLESKKEEIQETQEAFKASVVTPDKVPAVAEERQIVFQPNPGPQTEFLAAPELEVLFGGAAGGGKAQPLSSLVATPYGWSFMRDIKVNSLVCTPDGGTAKVIQVHPQGVQDIYEITFQDGSKVRATDDHLWLAKPVRDGSERFKPRTTKEIRESNRQHVIPLGIVQFDEKELPLPPYLLGAILGDGCITTNSIGFTSADSFIINELKKYCKVSTRTGKYQYGLLGLNPTLRELDLIGLNSHTKFIPWDYCNASYEQRLELIQGLMDTDGYVSIDGKVYFTSVSIQMLNQMAELIRSVGGTAKIMKGHTLYIRHPNSVILFKLPRKKNRCHPKNINNKIISINLVGKEEAKCITIDSKEQLYLTDHSVVTHNSYALIGDPIRYFSNPNFVGLLLRKTNDELRELVWKTKELYPKISGFKSAKFHEQASEWRFPSGARLWMSYLDRDDDALRYQGQAYSWIGFDELTHWNTPFAWNYLRSRLRTPSGSGLESSLSMRGTTNPGGPGHSWVKKMFIDPAPYNQAFWATDIDTGETLLDPETGKPLFKRRFIPSRLSDNPYLALSGDYRRSLLSMSEGRRKQLLDGDWTIADGAAFPEFSHSVHVVEPFEIDHNWTRFRSADYGYSSNTAVHWFAIHPSTQQLIVYRELYVSKVTGTELAQMINNIEREERIAYGVLDSSVWHKRGEGPSIAEVMLNQGCRWRPSDRSAGSRIAGKNRLHELLKVDEDTGEPGIIFFNNCRQIIADLPVIPIDPRGTEDIDPKFLSDHAYDSIRYGIMSRPKSFAYQQQSYSPVGPVDQIFGY